MRHQARDAWILGLAGAAAMGGALLARSGRAEDGATTVSAPPRRNTYAEGLATSIDAHLEARIKKAGLAVSPPCDDAEFLRRVSIDLVGVPPAPDEVVSFLADQTSGKRERKVDELLTKPEHAHHWAEIWTDLVEMDAKGIEGNREARIRVRLRDWFEEKLQKNVPFDETVRELLTAEGFIDENGAVGYFMAYQQDAKQLTATASRTFMGLQIECAQCHDHPFADWKREQFMGMAAFFSRVRPLRENLPKDAKDAQGKQKMPHLGVQEGDRGELVLDEKDQPVDPKAQLKALKEKMQAAKQGTAPGQKGAAAKAGMPPVMAARRVVDPAFIVPALAVPRDAKSRRDALARLVTDDRNPYFRAAITNRLWSLLTGRAIVATTEDLSDKDAGKDRELLTILERGFRDMKCDHKEILRSIAKTKAYARTSRGAADDKLEGSYAKGVVRPIDGRALARTLTAALFMGERTLDQGRKQQEEQILTAFERLFGETTIDPKKYEETIPQALKMFVGGPMQGGGGKRPRDIPLPTQGATPVAALGRLLSRYDDPRERVTRIYLASVCRPPRKPELDMALKFVEEAGKGPDAYEDLMWALVNSSEFRFNR